MVHPVCMRQSERETREILENKWKASNAGKGKLPRRVGDILIRPETEGRPCYFNSLICSLNSGFVLENSES